MLEIDGSQGEGGGQVLRTCLSLSALTGRPFRLSSIRAGRSKPGLRPQHLTAVYAVAEICGARTKGAALNATTLEFRPGSAPKGGAYEFDVAAAAKGGSAGSTTLILQALLWPLLFAKEPSTLLLHGGTHVPFSPSYHYLANVIQPAFQKLGANFALELLAWGWYPRGGGQIKVQINPIQEITASSFAEENWMEISGIAAVTNLPAHIPQRMARRASNLLVDLGLRPHIQPVRERASAPGAGIFLWAPGAGFSSLGRPGLSSEKVAELAVAGCRAFIENKAAVDKNLADQLLLPLALANGSSTFSVSELTAHTFTNAELLRLWLDVPINIRGRQNEKGIISITGSSFIY